MPDSPAIRGPLLIVSGPSGTGKSTLVQQVIDSGKWPVRRSISATTRKPRMGEIDGVHYHFWTPADFSSAVAADQFLESANVHGESYGTLRREVDPYRAAGTGVLLVIDVQGAKQVWQKIADHVSIFVRTSSLEEYERRLRQRATEDEAGIRRRLDNARAELSEAGLYRYHITNDQIDLAFRDLCEIVAQSFHCGG